MVKSIIKSLKESFITILPVYLIVLILSIVLKFPSIDIINFTISSILLAIGITLFNFGANISMILIGSKIGKRLVKTKKVVLISFVCFIIGLLVTIAEPDLRVLSSQFSSIPNYILILVVSFGVGLALLISSLRTIYKQNLKTILLVLYGIIFILIWFVPKEFIPIAFDTGGATTGPISSALILALGMGLTTYRNDKNAKDNSFGFLTLCSVCPIIVVLIISFFYSTDSTYNIVNNNLPLLQNYLYKFLEYFKIILLSLLPIFVLYLIFKNIYNNFTKKDNKKILLGFIITLLGLIIFLIGANVGYINIGYKLGTVLTSNYSKYILPISFILAFFIEMAEPAVRLTTSKIEEITDGSISKKLIQSCIAIGVGLAFTVSIFRSLTGTSILYFIIPGYLVIFILSYMTPNVFSLIGFDCSGIASGPLTTSFLLPICIGVCITSNQSIISDAFGLIAIISIPPVIIIQILGILYNMKQNMFIDVSKIDDTIIDYEVITC